MQNDLGTQFWIDHNKDISKCTHQGEQLILTGDWNSESSEVNICMETQVLANTICYLHGYSYDSITYQRSNECPINGIYF